MKINLTKIILTILILFIISVFYLALSEDKRYSTEKIVGREVDNFEIKLLMSDDVFTKKNLTNDKFYLFNIWASWCLPCKKEHPMLIKLNMENNIKIIGVNYKDNKLNAESFLATLGNPYDVSLRDKDGTKSIIFGVFGVPESILVNKKNVIIKKFIGPLNNDDLNFIMNTINEK